MSDITYYADRDGNYIGGQIQAPEGATIVSNPPQDGRQKWDGTKWLPIPNFGMIYLTQYREQRILEGISVNGISLRGDNDTAIRLQGAAIDAQLDPNYTVDWSVGGEKVTLTGAQVIGLHALGRGHIRKCFDVFFAIKDNLNTYQTTEEIAQAFDQAYGAL